jgi:hypothetical protein
MKYFRAVISSTTTCKQWSAPAPSRQAWLIEAHELMGEVLDRISELDHVPPPPGLNAGDPSATSLTRLLVLVARRRSRRRQEKISDKRHLPR